MLNRKYISLGNADNSKGSCWTPITAAACEFNDTENRIEITNHIELLLMFTALGTKMQLKATVLMLISCLTLDDFRKHQILMHKDKEQALALESHVVCQK